MDKNIEALVKYLKIKKEDDNSYSIEKDWFYIGTREELEKIHIKVNLTRDEWVESVKNGSTNMGYDGWIKEFRSDIIDLNLCDDTMDTFVINDEEIIVMKQDEIY